MIVPYTTNRKIEFKGEHKNDSLLIGNFGDVEFVADGAFDLSGMIYCPKGAIQLDVNGEGAISFYGVCKKLIIRNVSGQCQVDLSEVTCKEVDYISLKKSAQLLLGKTKIVRHAVLSDKARLQVSTKTILINYSVSGNSEIARQSKVNQKEYNN